RRGSGLEPGAAVVELPQAENADQAHTDILKRRLRSRPTRGRAESTDTFAVMKRFPGDSMNAVSPPRRALAGAFVLPAALALVTALAACSMPGSTSTSDPRAMAPLQAKSGSAVAGTIWFTQQADGVRVVARVSGLTANREHGFHVHETGDCSAPDGMSAGGHFNPTAQPHGPQGAPHHGGDMPSLKADAMGNAEATFTLDGVAVGTGPTGLIGKGVIVHAQPDDYKTQPTGNAGGRIACGVIVAAPGSEIPAKP
ncbi:MAG: superoxide dismutase family protein, partial [Solirubrobacteraceae bacterium]|nr:superoxide dismutase family protein [Solirubrobacteraceae bacterium]